MRRIQDTREGEEEEEEEEENIKTIKNKKTAKAWRWSPQLRQTKRNVKAKH